MLPTNIKYVIVISPVQNGLGYCLLFCFFVFVFCLFCFVFFCFCLLVCLFVFVVVVVLYTLCFQFSGLSLIDCPFGIL